MPTYEYECVNCGERFEMRRRVDDSDSEITCPKCGAECPRRVFSLFATPSSNQACSTGGFT